MATENVYIYIVFLVQTVLSVQHVVNCLTLTVRMSLPCQRTWLWRILCHDTWKSVVEVCAYHSQRVFLLKMSLSVLMTAVQSPVLPVTCVIRLLGRRAELRGSVHSVVLLTAPCALTSFTHSEAPWLATVFTRSLMMAPSRRMVSADSHTALITRASWRQCSVTDARFTCVICVFAMEKAVMLDIKCCCLKQLAQWSRYIAFYL